jgi:hypothetical protein
MSLIPEKPLLFFPHVAVTLGLHEAILLQTLKEIACHQPADERNGFRWHDIPGASLLALLPFWSEAELQNLTAKLREQGILLIGSAPLAATGRWRFAFNERRTATPRTADRAGSTVQPIRNDWQPERDLLAQLAQYGIPAAFALEQVPEFVTYWSERGEPRHSWGAKFLKQVVRCWREQEATRTRRDQEISMTADWQPGADALEILLRAGINRNFIEDAVPEFVLYWRDRGTQSSTWNSQFIQHVRRQWARYTATLANDTTPRPMVPEWRPDPAVFDVLAMAGIGPDFAANLVPEFALYWQESGAVLNTWNTKFLQYVKRQWALRNNPAEVRHATRQATDRAGSTRSRDLVAELSDRSWAG